MTHGVAKKKPWILLPLPTSSLAAGHCILLVAFLLLLLSLLKCLSNTLLPRHSFGHHVLMTFLSNYLLEGALRCLWLCLLILPPWFLSPHTWSTPETCLPPEAACFHLFPRGLRPNSSRWTASHTGLPVGLCFHSCPCCCVLGLVDLISHSCWSPPTKSATSWF